MNQFPTEHPRFPDYDTASAAADILRACLSVSAPELKVNIHTFGYEQ
jgi:hypothetical protein